MKKLVLLFAGLYICLEVTAQITNGLVAYYPFNSNANDASGHNHNGTAINATLTTDRFGIANSAYYFNGTDAYIDIPDDNDFHVQSVTLACWTNISIPSQSGQQFEDFIQKAYGTDYFNSYASGFDTYAPGIAYAFTDGSSQTFSYYPYTLTNQWFHYVVTFNQPAGEIKTYINGVLFSTQNASFNIPYDDHHITIGAEDQYETKMFFAYGKIDEVRIYNRALFDSEVGLVYQQGCSKPTGLTVTNITATSATVSWNPVASALSYQLQGRKKNTTQWQTFTTTSTSKNFTGLTPNTIYEGRIQTVCSNTPLITSGYTNIGSFTTASSFTAQSRTTSDSKANNFDIMLSSNPVSSAASLFITGGIQPVTITLTDLSGKTLWQKEKCTDRNISLPVQNFANGIYMVTVTGTTQRKTIKLVKSK